MRRFLLGTLFLIALSLSGSRVIAQTDASEKVQEEETQEPKIKAETLPPAPATMPPPTTQVGEEAKKPPLPTPEAAKVEKEVLPTATPPTSALDAQENKNGEVIKDKSEDIKKEKEVPSVPADNKLIKPPVPGIKPPVPPPQNMPSPSNSKVVPGAKVVLPPPEGNIAVEPGKDESEEESGEEDSASDSSTTGEKKPSSPLDPNVKGAAALPPGQELVNIDFPEPTEIKDIIKAVALWTGKNVILDRKVSGKVQIISPQKVTKEEAYQAFLSALNLLGLTTVETGKVIKIMPVRTAVKGNLKTILGSTWTPMTDEIITQIVPLKYIDSKKVNQTLTRIVSANSIIAYEPTNTLIVSDTGYKVRRILDIIRLLDIKGQQPQVAIVPIKYADAKNVTDQVTKIFESATKKAAGGASYLSYKIMSDDRTNSVIIFGPPRTISDIRTLVKRFDIPLDDPTHQSTIHVRPLEYADAEKMATTLSSLATGGKSSSSLRRPPIPSGPNGRPGDSSSVAVADLGDNVKITADKSSNSLLITGSRSAFNAVNSIIRKLDVRKSQVFLEADILDVDADNGFKFGTAIFGGRRGPKNSNIATTWEAAPLGPLVVASGSAGTATGTTGVNATDVAKVFAEDLTIGVLSGEKVTIPGIGEVSPGALIKMIKTDSNNRVLSSPQLLAANNEEATISVGNTIFYKSSLKDAQTGAVLPKPEKEKVDMTLTFKPNISLSNYVTFEVQIEANNFTGIDAATDMPKIATRKSKQLVTAKNNQTIVVSGLLQTQQTESFQKVPLLGDIPILGWLFRNSSLGTRRSNLMIFLTPHIVHGAEDLAAVYKAKIKERDDFMEKIYGSNFKDEEFYAMMPKEEDGAYQSSGTDEIEKKRRDTLMKELYQEVEPEPEKKEAASNEGAAKEDEVNPKDLESPISVPAMDGDGGGYDSGGDSAAPPPPPPPADVEPPEDMGGE